MDATPRGSHKYTENYRTVRVLIAGKPILAAEQLLLERVQINGPTWNFYLFQEVLIALEHTASPMFEAEAFIL